MAKHKAPTEVAIAPIEEHSSFQRWITEHWPKLAVLAVALSGVALFMSYREQQAEKNYGADWAELMTALPENGLFNLPAGSELGALSERFQGTDAGPWVRALEASKRLDERDYTGAKQAIDALAAEAPGHLLVRETFKTGEDSESTTLVELVSTRVGELQAWEAEHPRLFGNPEPPQDAPRVRINTNLGSFEVALYNDKAPVHVANFLKLCEEGYYNGTRFHRVMPGFMIQGGDPNSRDEDRTLWGQGGPDEKLDPELSELAHFEGFLAAAKQPGDEQSSGSQFYVTTGTPHHLDGQHTIFGKLTSGQETVDAIVSLPLEAESRDRPLDPATIESAEIL